MTVRIITADVRDGLAALPDESVHCCITSPPYFGLRSYGTEPQIWGGDPDCQHDWQAALWRPARWGECDDNTPADKQRTNAGSLGYRGQVRHQSICRCGAWTGELGLEPTPALYIEHLVSVFAEVKRVLRSDGTLWVVIGDSYCSTDKWGGGKSGNSGKHTVSDDGEVPSWAVRRRKQTIPGLKPKDLVGIPWRLAFALQDAGWYLRCDIIWAKPNPMPESVTDRCTSSHEYVFHLSKSAVYYYDGDAIKEPFETNPKENYPERATILERGSQLFAAARGNDRGNSGWFPAAGGRNKRSVWTVATVPSSVPHFATYPPALIEPCILAGCPVGGTILDPFIGVGTTAIAAERFGRNCIGIELSPKYAAIAERRARSPGFPLEFPEAAE